MLELTIMSESLPLGTEELLRFLDIAVPRKNIEPGEDIQQALYQAGARKLVDILKAKFDADSMVIDETATQWYSSDPELTNFIEGNW